MDSARSTNARTSRSWSEAITTSELRQARTSWCLSLTLQPLSQTQPPSIKRCTLWSKSRRPQHPFQPARPISTGCPANLSKLPTLRKTLSVTAAFRWREPTAQTAVPWLPPNCFRCGKEGPAIRQAVLAGDRRYRKRDENPQPLRTRLMRLLIN